MSFKWWLLLHLWLKQPGLYVAGWLKRGPQGVIATTMYDAYETAEVIVSDIKQDKPMLSNDTFKYGSKVIIPILHQRGIRTVSYKDWKKIEEKENEAGRAKHKPREKFGRVEDAMQVLDTWDEVYTLSHCFILHLISNTSRFEHLFKPIIY